MNVDPSARTVAWDEETSPSRPVLGERYELLGLLGAGGMGNVYKARDLELDELVAVKVLRPELVGAPGALDRFRREVKLARRVTHPNVARVFDIGDRGGDKILTMELIDGEPLSALIERPGGLSAELAVKIAVTVCRGVGAAHAAGVVHRDLKPDNVLIAKDGRVVVSDFGIARAALANDGRTGGGVIGTPAYMAPEQVEGSPDIDERADVYAFGAMLFEMLTGGRPWQGDSVIAVAAARLLRPPPDPRTVRSDLDPTLAEITLRCMARSPSDRYATMDAIADALGTVALPSGDPASRRSSPQRESVFEGRGGALRRVAVLPFRNLGPADQDYLADALTEDLIDLLTASRGLRVQSRGVVMRYRGQDRDPREVGRELDVQVVVEGSVRKGPGTFRISARLVSVAEGFQLWAKRFDGSDADMLALNDVVARAVAEALTVELPSANRDLGGDAEAVDLYLRAKAGYHGFYEGDLASAIGLFERASARSPEDPRILAGLVLSRNRSPIALVSSVPGLLADARRAIALGPALPDGHVALGAVLFHANEEVAAVRAFRHALRVSTSAVEAHDFLGRMLVEADCDEGLRHLEVALALEPALSFAKIALARHHALRGRWEQAHAQGGIATEARFVFWKKDAARALEMLAKLPELEARAPAAGSPIARVVRSFLELTAFGTSPPDERFLLPDGVKPRARAFLAQIHTEMRCSEGDRDGALRALERCDEFSCFDVAWFDRCSMLDLIRDEPAFVAVRERVGERAGRIVAAYLEPLV